jgi:hypothetical protein
MLINQLVGFPAATNIPTNNFSSASVMISGATHNTNGQVSTSKNIIIIINNKNYIG